MHFFRIFHYYKQIYSMKQLIIYTHFSPFSFNCAIKDRIIQQAQLMGHETILRDLYFMNFKPSLDWIDMNAQKNNEVPIDIATEQKYIAEAEVLIFVFPIWWNSMPAVLKGYIDRVFSNGFAYSINGEVKGLLNGKKVMIFNSLGGDTDEDMQNAMRTTIDKGIMEFCGMDVELHRFFPNVIDVDRQTRESYLDDIGREYRDIINKKASK